MAPRPARSPPLGTVGDSCDNAHTETVIGLYKTGPGRLDGSLVRAGRPLELARLGYVDWFYHVRLHQNFEYRTPAERETDYHNTTQTPDEQPLARQRTVH